MTSKRRSSEIIKLSASVPINVPLRRRSSWSLSEQEPSDNYLSDEDELTPLALAEQLTTQRWHEVGNGPHPLCASNNFDVMVDQLSSILASRVRDLLIYWAGPLRNPPPSSGRMDYLRLDSELGDYNLEDSLSNSIRKYVTCIGKLYNHVGFHSFEHAAHVTISMNKLVSMVTGNRSFRSQPSQKCSIGIGGDPRISFAMVFSALIHDVGHTGVPNSVLVEEEDELAILHNDVSVAEQNSLQVAFSMLQKDEFAQLKRCICPTPEERKVFRKKVISMVMVTDFSDQERIQIVASRWNAAFPSCERGVNSNNGEGGTQQPRQAAPQRPIKKEIQSPEIRESLRRRRFTMFTTDAAAEEFANDRRSRRLGIRTSMDFSGMLLDAYSNTDQLQQHAVLETMMNVADVAHTMQSFQVFVKWNRRLFKEFYIAHSSDRLSFNPSENWYENQIGFFTHYIIPLSKKMKVCGVFGTTGNVFEYFAIENKKRWTEEGETISEEIIRDVKEEVEREQRLRNGCIE
mmetsp:Transcript_29238/g.62172  ORF Transcript_29238/g.62172 Transcript_29238/m.62172 type:complete len:516 (+) Transcript_29238:86-1633(+)|eukprot:CAMPEP_0172324732 /NCGR_PEP_ID=MMETSP1058-20130122/52146_1 /TAXON_ID=83371 /ORGANISM="Detonula confervacea, Strain CCMP 353" /LENGTH=515 /DNA_ID=CAMNT_0013041091 /DNA_START=27 /DNA_END=1574 /DNA_ORIENTATION=+